MPVVESISDVAAMKMRSNRASDVLVGWWRRSLDVSNATVIWPAFTSPSCDRFCCHSISLAMYVQMHRLHERSPPVAIRVPPTAVRGDRLEPHRRVDSMDGVSRARACITNHSPESIKDGRMPPELW